LASLTLLTSLQSMWWLGALWHRSNSSAQRQRPPASCCRYGEVFALYPRDPAHAVREQARAMETVLSDYGAIFGTRLCGPPPKNVSPWLWSAYGCVRDSFRAVRRTVQCHGYQFPDQSALSAVPPPEEAGDLPRQPLSLFTAKKNRPASFASPLFLTVREAITAPGHRSAALVSLLWTYKCLNTQMPSAFALRGSWI